MGMANMLILCLFFFCSDRTKERESFGREDCFYRQKASFAELIISQAPYVFFIASEDAG